jgi:hypothetical protein
MIGRRPHAAFGNSTGDREMLEWTGAGAGARLAMLVLHDDAAREYAYGPAQDLPDTRVGAFTAALYGEAKKDGWPVISMKNGRIAWLPGHGCPSWRAQTPCVRPYGACGRWSGGTARHSPPPHPSPVAPIAAGSGGRLGLALDEGDRQVWRVET